MSFSVIFSDDRETYCELYASLDAAYQGITDFVDERPLAGPSEVNWRLYDCNDSLIDCF